MRPARYAATREDDFIVQRDVPGWKEHTNRHDFGEAVDFDEASLKQIVHNCNERIADTGDYPGIILRHNDSGEGYEPLVVGFAGPFRMGVVGKRDPKPAILADLRIYTEDAERCKRYPRLSVEYYASKRKPKDGYFDAVALLGSEAP